MSSRTDPLYPTEIIGASTRLRETAPLAQLKGPQSPNANGLGIGLPHDGVDYNGHTLHMVLGAHCNKPSMPARGIHTQD
jgi:hypothetical protein